MTVGFAPWRILLVVAAVSPILSGCGSPEERAAKAMARFDVYYANRDLYHARVEIRSAIHAQDDIPEFWNKLGRVELGLNNVQNAYSAYSRVLELDLDNVEANQAMAELSYAGAKQDDALTYAKKVLKTEPRNLRMLLITGLVAYDRAQYDDARAVLARMQAIDPANEDAAILLSRVQYAAGDAKGAIATVENSIKANGVSTQKLIMLIDFYNRQNDFRNLNHSYARLFRIDPNNVPLRFDYARALYENGLPDRALIVIERLQSRYPGDPKLQQKIVDLWTSVGSKAIALDQIRRFAEAGNDQMKLALGQLAVDQRRYAEAEQILAPFIGTGKITPANAQANALYASALSGLGRKGQALALANQILDFDRTNSHALLLRLNIEIDRRDLVAALNDAQALTQDNPDLAGGWIALARIYMIRNERALADGIFGRAIDTLSDSADLLNAYTVWLLDTDRRDLALDAADQFTRRNPRLLDGWKMRADLCLDAGDTDCVRRIRDNVGPLKGGDKLRASLDAALAIREKSRPPLPNALAATLQRILNGQVDLQDEAHRLMMRGRRGDAERLAREVKERQPDNDQAQLVLAAIAHAP